MITIKLTNYSEEECRVLCKLIDSTVMNMMCDYCPDSYVEEICPCEHKTLCKDLSNFQKYLREEIITGFPHCKGGIN